MNVQSWTFTLVGLSFALYIGVAIWSRARSTGDFYVAGGNVGPIVNGMATARYFEIVMASLTFRDAWLTVAKGIVFGMIVGTVPSFHGLSVGQAATEVPVAASRGVVVSILAIFLASGLFVVVS